MTGGGAGVERGLWIVRQRRAPLASPALGLRRWRRRADVQVTERRSGLPANPNNQVWIFRFCFFSKVCREANFPQAIFWPERKPRRVQPTLSGPPDEQAIISRFRFSPMACKEENFPAPKSAGVSARRRAAAPRRQPREPPRAPCARSGAQWQIAPIHSRRPAVAGEFRGGRGRVVRFFEAMGMTCPRKGGDDGG